MIITAYDTGARAPADHFEPDTRVKVPHRAKRPPHNKLSADERERRRQLALMASDRVPSQRAMAKLLSVSQPDVSRYLKGRRSVPKRCIPTLRKLVGVQA